MAADRALRTTVATDHGPLTIYMAHPGTWPASFPVVRIDQILVRGVDADSSRVLAANGSDHRPVEARISW